MSPPLMILIGMTVVLTFSVIMSVRKFFKKRKQEKKASQSGDTDTYISIADSIDERWWDDELEF